MATANDIKALLADRRKDAVDDDERMKTSMDVHVEDTNGALPVVKRFLFLLFFLSARIPAKGIVLHNHRRHRHTNTTRPSILCHCHLHPYTDCMDDR